MNIKKLKQIFAGDTIPAESLDSYFSERFSERNIDGIMKIILSLQIYAIEYGLLACEKYCAQINETLFQTMLQLIVDGTDPRELGKFYDNFLKAEIQKIETYYDIMKQGLNGIYEGLNPRFLEGKLNSLLGKYTLGDIDHDFEKIYKPDENIDLDNPQKADEPTGRYEKYMQKKEDDTRNNLENFNPDSICSVIKVIVHFAEQVRREGLRKLEEYMPYLTDKDFSAVMRMMLDNTADRSIPKYDFIQFNKIEIMFESLKNKRLYEKILYINMVGYGMQIFQEGANPFKLYECMQIVSGVDVFFDFKITTEKDSVNYISENVFEKINKEETWKIFDEFICKLDFLSLQNVIRETEKFTLGIAFFGSSTNAQKKIRENTTPRVFQWLLDFINAYTEDNDTIETEIIESMQIVVEIIRRLEKNGDIIFARGGTENLGE